MKEESDVLVIGCRLMANVSPVTPSSLAQQQFPTPSPFSFSVASTRWSSRPSLHYSNLALRFLALVLSFASAISLAVSSSRKKDHHPSSFTVYPELMYCFIIQILAFFYTSFQLFKGICDIAHRGILMSDRISDYISFTLDQLVGYLLISSSSVAIPVILHIEKAATLWTAAIISITMSFVTFLVIATCALLSGYKLCKRIIW